MNSNPIKSLECRFSKRELKKMSSLWLDNYLPWLSAESLCDSFEDVFNENALLYDIGDNVKEVMQELLMKYYHNESYIKARLVSKFKNSNTTSFFEMPVNNSRIDFCSINNHSTAYEIKTKYDNLDRLTKQIDDYLTTFEYVYVVCSSEKTTKILSIVPDEVGVYEYNDSERKVIFRIVRTASISSRLNGKSQIMLLRKHETPKNINCLSDAEVNCLFKRSLKNRYQTKWSAFCKECGNINILDYQAVFNSL